ncbi:MAG: phosphodiester glycosidase family protein [Gemmatimonadaceae bacterium]|nr:phosphodiester glycosidase family protein [Gemmatimonadaceae bacterium]
MRQSAARAALAVALVLLAACARTVVPPAVSPARLPFRADTLRTVEIAPGLLHHFVYAAEGPWAIHLLELHRDACWSLRAAKGTSGAAGRTTTSAILRGLSERAPVYAGVNADFFSLATGVPQTALIIDGSVVAGPTPRPVFWVDSAGRPGIGTLAVRGSVQLKDGSTYPLGAWNRMSVDGSSRIEVGLTGMSPSRVAFVDTLPAGSTIAAVGGLLVAGPRAPADVRRALLALARGDELLVMRSLRPAAPREAVGGWPIILRDSVITVAVDSAGATFAPVRHPRTAVGLADGGRTVYLVVVDGRQKPYSDGMTLRELARLFQSIGVRDALNLDGGGSTAMIAADPDATHTLRLQNRPSDKGGERTVGDALAVVRSCGT